MKTDSEITKVTTMQCARQVVETVPVLIRLIRSGVRDSRGLSIPQTRVLSLLSRQPGAGVSEVAANLDVTIPTASVLVDRLVKKGLVQRREDPQERRRVILTMTTEGEQVFEESRTRAQKYFAHILAHESPEKIAKISEGLLLLADAATAFNATKET